MYVISSNTKYINDIKNIGWNLNACMKLNFAISIAKLVPLHATQSIPNFSLNKHFGTNDIYSDLKSKKHITKKIIIAICINIKVLYCFFTLWLYIMLYIIVKYFY